jgi:hypothetical protein
MLVHRGVALVAVAVMVAWPPILSLASNEDSNWFRRECVHVVPSALQLTTNGVALSTANATDANELFPHHQKTADQAMTSASVVESVPQGRIPKVSTPESTATERSPTTATNTAISRLLGVVFTVSTAAIFSIL